MYLKKQYTDAFWGDGGPRISSREDIRWDLTVITRDDHVSSHDMHRNLREAAAVVHSSHSSTPLSLADSVDVHRARRNMTSPPSSPYLFAGDDVAQFDHIEPCDSNLSEMQNIHPYVDIDYVISMSDSVSSRMAYEKHIYSEDDHPESRAGTVRPARRFLRSSSQLQDRSKSLRIEFSSSTQQSTLSHVTQHPRHFTSDGADANAANPHDARRFGWHGMQEDIGRTISRRDNFSANQIMARHEHSKTPRGLPVSSAMPPQHDSRDHQRTSTSEKSSLCQTSPGASQTTVESNIVDFGMNPDDTHLLNRQESLPRPKQGLEYSDRPIIMPVSSNVEDDTPLSHTNHFYSKNHPSFTNSSSRPQAFNPLGESPSAHGENFHKCPDNPPMWSLQHVMEMQGVFDQNPISYAHPEGNKFITRTPQTWGHPLHEETHSFSGNSDYSIARTQTSAASLGGVNAPEGRLSPEAFYTYGGAPWTLPTSAGDIDHPRSGESIFFPQ
ncbi:hypothetical protein SCHPADRAFT_986887 [Schizopora paradoxa]|uniref:Uncharacterized protein n=1 Tax=Schizopora paradoxa TaxID=27342 RepID=A0A0H2RMS0_9AGAM|nr:hypothetical protein SCHPADRAFT_986887 [Schizopora paradoxa]